MSTLKDKLPEIALEALFVVFAILLALAADEWREERQRREIAERALEAIEAEMVENRDELLTARDSNLVLLTRLQEAVSDDEAAEGISLQYEYATLSGAAWETAQVTQAVHYADFELVQRLARVYDMQGLFVESQRSVVDQMSGVAAGDTDAFLRAMLGKLGIAMSVEAGYAAMLDSTLVVMEAR